jgi:pSer/pThr/pTyr-binding forkhead associated (FHA) protein
MAKLVISGTPHELTEEIITIGRAPDNLIVLEDPSVSARHAEIRAVSSAYYLKDLGSTNGTRLNGNPITESKLAHGDRLRFGGIEARVETIDPTATQPLPRMQEIEARPAEASAAPADFTNASPFQRRKKQRDAISTAILAAAAIAVLAFLASMVAVITMHAPTM